jgi:hypothetical protein
MRTPAIFLLGLAAMAGAAPVCFEAEDAQDIAAPIKLVTKAASEEDAACVKGASGGAFLEIPEGAGKPPEVAGGKAVFTFDVPKDGSYYLWARVWWNDGCGNSIAMSIDGAKPFTFGQDATYKCWHWVKSPPRLSQLKLKAGTHTLTLTNREDGLRIDQILLESNRRFVPIDIETVTQQAPTGKKP